MQAAETLSKHIIIQTRTRPPTLNPVPGAVLQADSRGHRGWAGPEGEVRVGVGGSADRTRPE